MHSWKWKPDVDEHYYKSARPTTRDIEYDTKTNAINQSLEEHGFFRQDSDLINITNNVLQNASNGSSNKREDLDNKMSDRQMIGQRGFNPFLQTSYVNDVVAHDMFLKPISSTFTDKSKVNAHLQ